MKYIDLIFENKTIFVLFWIILLLSLLKPWLFVNGILIGSLYALGSIGLSNGLANVLGSSTWAELYGVKHIGSIKALTTALMVFSTAFGTALFGVLIDTGFQLFFLVLNQSLSIVKTTYGNLNEIQLFE